MSKDILRKKFSSNPKKYYKVELFDELGFKRKQCKCGKCGYVWFSRVDSPKQCPRCKRYDWMKENKNNG